MAEVAARELRNDTAGVLRRVEAGEDVTITVHGHPVARVVPIRSQRRWANTAELLDIVENHQADPGLRVQLTELVGEMTDEATDPWPN
ncbi:type II toxin-antitoxin system Phd/YefM family antitoxin [Microbacterium pseudoresistens]|uniref:Antitoxin n=1 Tax=Microbacterium pseudoresistens TaxID=640634 RepID=A0A7Y9EWL5_9MICO|nr:type II toxin-antitoxin system prevent-host-death family antitoxin [Microbacterium pseudoresistens]NYD55287.1 prevent-host-death family protein [Microbacterium pseudoresistens]